MTPKDFSPSRTNTRPVFKDDQIHLECWQAVQIHPASQMLITMGMSSIGRTRRYRPGFACAGTEHKHRRLFSKQQGRSSGHSGSYTPSKPASQNAPGAVFSHGVGGSPLHLIDKGLERVLRGFGTSETAFFQQLAGFEHPLSEAHASGAGSAHFLSPGPILAAFCFGSHMREVAP